MKMNTALHNVSFVWNFIFYSSFKHFPYKTEDYAQSNSITPKSAWRTMQNRCTSAQTGSSETSQAVYENKPCAVHPVASDGQCAELVGEYRL